MRFFASWWERIPTRLATPALVSVIAGGVLAGHGHRLIAQILGFYLG